MKNILVNYYPFLLWNSKTYGVSKRYATSNLYESSIQVKQTNTDKIEIKNNHVESLAKRVNPVEYLLIKYVPAILLVWLLWNFNLYYVSQVGLMIATVAYVGFFLLRDFNQKFNSWLFLIAAWITYLYFFAVFPQEMVEFKGNWIMNYAFQYFALFYVVETILENIFTERLKDTYKIEKYSATYFTFNDDEIKKNREAIKRKIRKYFKFFLGFLFLVSSFFGGIDLMLKITAKKEAEKQILTSNKNEVEIIRKQNGDALIELLEKQSKEVGIRVHTKEDLELIKEDFEKYVKSGVISYSRIAIGKSNTIIELDTKKRVYFNFKKRNHIYLKSWIKMYEDGFYRYHFKNDGKVFIVTDIKAR